MMLDTREWPRIECDAGAMADGHALLERLVHGESAVVVLRGLLPQAEFAAAATALTTLMDGASTARYVNGTLTTIGPFLARYLSRIDDYFRDADEAAARFAQADFTLAERVRARLCAVLGLRGMEPAREGDGRRYGESVVRLHADGIRNPLHNDNIMRDAAGTGLALAELDHQLSCVVCIQECDTGGELKIYRKPWSPDDEAHKIDGGLGYRHEVVAGAPCHTFKPSTGDVYLINPTYYHEIERVGGASRLTLGFFIGLSDDSPSDAVVWS